jgi:hypothetical protein
MDAPPPNAAPIVKREKEERTAPTLLFDKPVTPKEAIEEIAQRAPQFIHGVNLADTLFVIEVRPQPDPSVRDLLTSLDKAASPGRRIRRASPTGTMTEERYARMRREAEQSGAAPTVIYVRNTPVVLYSDPAYKFATIEHKTGPDIMAWAEPMKDVFKFVAILAEIISNILIVRKIKAELLAKAAESQGKGVAKTDPSYPQASKGQDEECLVVTPVLLRNYEPLVALPFPHDISADSPIIITPHSPTIVGKADETLLRQRAIHGLQSLLLQKIISRQEYLQKNIVSLQESLVQPSGHPIDKSIASVTTRTALRRSLALSDEIEALLKLCRALSVYGDTRL